MPPLKRGSSNSVVSGNIKEMVDSWKGSGKIGPTRPATKKKAVQIAVAAAMTSAHGKRKGG